MDFSLNEEQRAFRDVVRRWVDAEAPKDWMRRLEADEENYPLELWDKLAEQGFFGIGIPGEWGGLADVNSRSIGVELANPGDRPFPEAQMAALERLLGEVMARWHIPAQGVIAHSDMAPSRKGDPGRRFD